MMDQNQYQNNDLTQNGFGINNANTNMMGKRLLKNKSNISSKNL